MNKLLSFLLCTILVVSVNASKGKGKGKGSSKFGKKECKSKKKSSKTGAPTISSAPSISSSPSMSSSPTYVPEGVLYGLNAGRQEDPNLSARASRFVEAELFTINPFTGETTLVNGTLLGSSDLAYDAKEDVFYSSLGQGRSILQTIGPDGSYITEINFPLKFKEPGDWSMNAMLVYKKDIYAFAQRRKGDKNFLYYIKMDPETGKVKVKDYRGVLELSAPPPPDVPQTITGMAAYDSGCEETFWAVSGNQAPFQLTELYEITDIKKGKLKKIAPIMYQGENVQKIGSLEFCNGKLWAATVKPNVCSTFELADPTNVPEPCKAPWNTLYTINTRTGEASLVGEVGGLASLTNPVEVGGATGLACRPN